MKRIVIIGGGLSGLATAYFIQQQALAKQQNWQITLLEKSLTTGGKIQSAQELDYLCEAGPNGFLTNKPDTLNLCKQLNIYDKLLTSNASARKRFIYSANQLHLLAHTPSRFLTSKLISWRGKLRIGAELWQSKRLAQNDESLAAFTRRRLGVEALDKLITPMAGGVFAGDPEKMSLQASFPRIHQLEQEYGGLFKALFNLRKQYAKLKAGGEVVASAAGPGGVLTSFVSGMQELTDALSIALGRENIKCQSAVESVLLLGSKKWQITTAAEVYFADILINATPAYIAADLFSSLNSRLAADLKRINYAPLAVVCLAYAKSQLKHDINGFGYLLAKAEQSPLLGTLWDSSIFINRAPDDRVLLRSMLGGARYPEILTASDEQLFTLTKKSIAQILGIEQEPELATIYRHSQAIPQYQIGHLTLVDKIMQQVNNYPGLYLTGNAYYGVGVNDCVAAAAKLVTKVMEKYVPE